MPFIGSFKHLRTLALLSYVICIRSRLSALLYCGTGASQTIWQLVSDHKPNWLRPVCFTTLNLPQTWFYLCDFFVSKYIIGRRIKCFFQNSARATSDANKSPQRLDLDSLALGWSLKKSIFWDHWEHKPFLL